MKKTSTFALILLFSVMVCSTSLSADEIQETSFTSSRTNIGVKLGFSKPIKDHYKGGSCFGLNLSFYITSQLSLELSGQQLTSEVTLEEDDLNSGTLIALPMQLSLRFQFTTSSRFVPYILAGVDYIFYTHEVDLSEWEDVRFSGENEVKNSIGFHGGLGLEFFITPSLSLCLDGQYIYSKTEAEWTFSDINNPGITASGEISNLQIDIIVATLGLKIYF